MKADAYDELTEREREVLSLIVAGHRNKVIALKLDVAVSTVESHVHGILNKFGVSTRLEAVHWMNQHRKDR